VKADASLRLTQAAFNEFLGLLDNVNFWFNIVTP
jgi:alkyl sulfatase BDS1-like metallo-beta-lactamase superfamily hydrolase